MNKPYTFRNEFLYKWRRKKIFFLVPFLLIFLTALCYTLFQKTFFVTTVTVKIGDNFGIEPTDTKILSTALINQNMLDKKNPSASVMDLAGKVLVTKDPASGVIAITLKGDKSARLTALANEIAHVYVGELLPKAEATNEELSKKEETRIKEYRNNLVKELQEAKKRLDDRERKWKDFNAQDEKVETLATSLKNRLSSLEAERSKLLTIYTPLYPGVVRIESEIGSIKEEIASLPPRPTGRFELEREFRDSEKIYATLNKKWQDIRFKKIEDLVSAKRIPVITAYAMRPQTLFDTAKRVSFLLSWALAAIAIGLAAMLLATISDTSILNKEDLALYARLPVVGSLPYIKNIVSKGARKHVSNLILKYEDQSDMIEPYRLLYTRISAGLFNGQQGKAILLTSSVPGEGKSLIASNLSLAISRSGKKVALIDCNMARPSINSIFGITKNMPGLADVLVKGASLESVTMNVTDILLGGGMQMNEVLRFKGLDRLNIISSGTQISAGGELLRSNKLDALLAELKAKYDCLIFDTPSVAASADSLILAPKADAIYIVYSQGRVPRGHLRSAVQQLSSSLTGNENKIAVLKGVIMNRCI